MEDIKKKIEDINYTLNSNNFSKKEFLYKLRDLFEFLSTTKGQTEQNIKIVDKYFNDTVSLDEKIVDESILDIIGHLDALHDTLEYPEIAKNFSSTPVQILQMVNDLIAQIDRE